MRNAQGLWCVATTSAPASGSGSSTPSRSGASSATTPGWRAPRNTTAIPASWAQMSADPELGLVYVPTEMATGDYYGGNRPGNTLFADSLRRPGRQDRPAQVALPDRASRRVGLGSAVRADAVRHARERPHGEGDRAADQERVPVRAQSRDRSSRSGRSRSGRSRSRTCRRRSTSPTQPFPTRPLPFDRQGVTENDLIDLTPELKAEALEVVKRYKMGPIFTPPW